MKRLLLVLAACGGDDAAVPDAPRVTPPTPDAAPSPAQLSARAFATTPTTVAVAETAALEVDITNLGGAFTGELQIDTPAQHTGCSDGFVRGGEMCELDLAIAPDHVGDLDVPITISASPGGSVTLHLPVTATAAPPLGVDPHALALGDVPLVGPAGQGGTGLLALRNNTSAPLGPISATIAGDAGFQVNDFDGCYGRTLAPVETCRIQVVYGPTTTAPGHATVTVAAGSEHTDVAITGTGTALLVAPGFNSDHLVVPDAYAGHSGGARRIQITNVVADALGPLEVKLTHADGSLANEFQLFGQNCIGATLGSFQICDVFVGLAKLDPGPATATLRIGTAATSVSTTLYGTAVEAP